MPLEHSRTYQMLSVPSRTLWMLLVTSIIF
jgi:hypothetical protein